MWNYKVLICDLHPPGYLIDEANGTFNVLPGNIDKSFGLLEAGVNSLSSDLKKLETRVDDIESLNLQAQIDQLRNQLQNDYYQLLIAYSLGTVGIVLGLVAMVLALLYRRKMHSFWEKASESST
jgi:predicted PurR-regulated permease PerM